jgi:hypothetical protein
VPLQNAIISITDVLGKEIKQIKTESKRTNIDVSELKQGVYFIKAVSKGEGIEVVRKFVKE